MRRQSPPSLPCAVGAASCGRWQRPGIATVAAVGVRCVCEGSATSFRGLRGARRRGGGWRGGGGGPAPQPFGEGRASGLRSDKARGRQDDDPRVASLEAELDGLRRSVSEAEQATLQGAELEVQVEAQARELATGRLRVAELEAQVEAQAQELAALGSELRASEGEALRLGARVGELEAGKERSDAQATTLQPLWLPLAARRGRFRLWTLAEGSGDGGGGGRAFPVCLVWGGVSESPQRLEGGKEARCAD